MIEKLPLELFGDEPEPDTKPSTAQVDSDIVPPTADMQTCQWCGSEVLVGADSCPECDSRIVPTDKPDTGIRPGMCQWCSAAIDPDDDVCPECGGNTGEHTAEKIPGLTVPLPESLLRSQVERETREEELELLGASGFLIDVASLILKNRP